MKLSRRNLFVENFESYSLFVGAFALDFSTSERCEKEKFIGNKLLKLSTFQICLREEFKKFKELFEYNHENLQRYFNR